MKRAIVLLCIALLVSSPVMAIARQSLREAVPDLPDDQEPLVVADVLIAIDIDANPGFADLTSRYADAFTAAGAASVATCAVEATGGTINFPPDVTYANYPVVVVLTSENWWEIPSNIDPADEVVLMNYLDSGGNLLLVGQDYMYGSHGDMDGASNPCYGFPLNYLGLDLVFQDFDGPTPPMRKGEPHDGERSEVATLYGRANWILVGLVVIIVANTVFINNPFYTDRGVPVSRGAGMGLDYEGEFASAEGVLTYYETDTFQAVWSGVEISAAGDEDFNEIIARLYEWFDGETPVQRLHWGAIKALYR